MGGDSGRNGSFKAGKGGDTPEASDKKTMSYNQGVMRKESAGVEYGLSARENFDVDSVEPTYDYAKDPLTGNATERRAPTQDDAYSVSSKGKSFSVL
jgi:hypothetical protein